MITTTNYPSPEPPSGVISNPVGTNIVLWPSYPPVDPSLVTTNWTTVVNQKQLPSTGVYINAVKHTGKWDYDLLTSYSYRTFTYTYSLTASNYATTTVVYKYAIGSTLPGLATAEKFKVPGDFVLNNDKLLVLDGNRTIYIEGSFRMSGQAQVIIAPGASLKIYVGGNIDLAGQGIVNYTLDASKFSLYGLPTCNSIAIGGNAAFTGVIYAPTANVTMNGSGVYPTDVVGAIIANTATMNGIFQFHYDEALGRAKILAKYTPASWQEL